MGFFKKIKKTVRKLSTKVTHPKKTVTTTVSKAIQNPARYTAAVLSGGTTELIRKAPVAGKIYSGAFDKVYAPTFNAAANYYTYGLSGQVQAAAAQPKGSNMAFNLGGFLGGVGSILGNVQGGNAGGVRAVGNVLTLASASTSKVRPPAPRPGQIGPQRAAPKSNVIVGGGAMTSAARAVGRKFFEKFPNLATAIQKYRNAGMTQVTRGRLYSLLKRFGPELIISGGILTAAAVSELMMAGPGTRRMNAANAKALRRAARRIKSFHKLCQHTDLIKTRRSAPRSFGRCGSCRKNPCSC